MIRQSRVHVELAEAAKQGNVERILQIASTHGMTTVNSKLYLELSYAPGESEVSTVLGLLVGRKYFDALLTLVAQGADINIQDDRGSTPLIMLLTLLTLNQINLGDAERYVRLFLQRGAIVKRSNLSFGSAAMRTTLSVQTIQGLLKNAFDRQPLILKDELAVYDYGEPIPTKTDFDLGYALALARMSDLAYKSQQEIMAAGLSGTSHVIVSPDRTLLAFVLGCSDKIVVCFRGTDNTSNWVRDNCQFGLIRHESGHGCVHGGFNNALSILWPELYQHLQTLKNRFSQNNPHIWFTGHSLGGALATLAIEQYTRLHPEALSTCHLYTFGAPLVGEQHFADYFNQRLKKQSYMVIMELDPVPALLPMSSPFTDTEKYRFCGNWRLIDSEGFLYNDQNYVNAQLGSTYCSQNLEYASHQERWVATLNQAALEIKPLVCSKQKGFYRERNNLIVTGLHKSDHNMAKSYLKTITSVLETFNQGKPIINNSAMRYKMEEALQSRNETSLLRFSNQVRNFGGYLWDNPGTAITGIAALGIGIGVLAYSRSMRP